MKTKIAMISLVSSVMFLTGCASIFYHPRYPVLEKPSKPTLTNVSVGEMGKMSPAAQETVTNNFDKLIRYCRELEAAIDGYNAFASEKNEALMKGELK